MSTEPAPAALVMGDMDVVRPLVLAGVRCSLFTTPRDPSRASRLVGERLPWIDHWAEPRRVVELLESFARRQPLPPVLVPQSDADLLLVSRNRERLGRSCRLLMPPPELVEDLVDKRRFHRLAEEARLPVPASAAVSAGSTLADAAPAPPVLVKPLTWSPRWRLVTPAGKALRIDDETELRRVSERVRAAGVDVLAQELVPGPESRMESYHAYLDADGAVAGEFTGRKIRTWPLRFGDSCAVETTAERDVLMLGREIVTRLGLIGLVKVDFKRAPDGSLRLLEINPRANLWQHPGARAGVNLPAMMWADLAERPRPASLPARPGVAWCQPLRDARAAHAAGVPLPDWLRFLRRCEARSEAALDDPLPLLVRAIGIVRARI